MTSTLTILSLTNSTAGWTLAQVPSEPAAQLLRNPADVYAVLDLAAGSALVAYSKATGQADLYRLQAQAPWIAPPTSIQIGNGWEQLSGLNFSNTGYLMAYEAVKGTFAFCALDDQLGLAGVYPFSRTHAPGLSKGFSMVRPFVLSNGVVFMGYAFDTGAVAMYTLTGVVSSPPGTPPVLATAIWDHAWAPG